MKQFTFTPEQKEEATKWYKENCPEVAYFIQPNTNGVTVTDILVDIYFKLKTVPFSFKPNEFIVGIEYKNETAIRIGKEAPNVRINNPHRKIGTQETHDQFALTILYNLFRQAQ